MTLTNQVSTTGLVTRGRSLARPGDSTGKLAEKQRQAKAAADAMAARTAGIDVAALWEQVQEYVRLVNSQAQVISDLRAGWLIHEDEINELTSWADEAHGAIYLPEDAPKDAAPDDEAATPAEAETSGSRRHRRTSAPDAEAA